MLLVLSITFGVLGLLHFIFSKTMERYAIDNGLLNSFIAVRMSGVLLLASSIALWIEDYKDYGFYGLMLFLLLASVIVHKFWDQPTALEQLKELLHFIKNLLLILLLWYFFQSL